MADAEKPEWWRHRLVGQESSMRCKRYYRDSMLSKKQDIQILTTDQKKKIKGGDLVISMEDDFA